MSLEEYFKDFVKPTTLLFGRIIGMCEIVTCLPTEELAPFLSDQEKAFGDYTPGRFAWQFANHVAFDNQTIVKGQLGLRETDINITPCHKCNEGHFPEGKYHIIWVAGKKHEVVRCQNML